MKKIFFILVFLMSNSFFGQTTRKIVKDFDGDLKNDTIQIDSDSRTLICKLSTRKFKKIVSKEIQKLNFGNTLLSTKNGFEFWNDFDRSGFKCVFTYNKLVKKMQLVEIRRVDDILSSDYGAKFKGLSTVNLITNNYVGNFYQVYNKKILKMPTINSEMVLPETYLETFSDILCFDYESKCLALYNKNKKK